MSRSHDFATCSQESGTCPDCVAACDEKPGWFMPGEAEKVASFLGISFEELFRTKLAVDWWEDTGDVPTTFVLAPALVGEDPGEEYPGNPRGTCVFLDENDRCSIHEVKPHECRQYWCGEPDSGVPTRHKAVAKAWMGHQDSIVNVLGREPVESYYSGGGIFGLLGW